MIAGQTRDSMAAERTQTDCGAADGLGSDKNMKTQTLLLAQIQRFRSSRQYRSDRREEIQSVSIEGRRVLIEGAAYQAVARGDLRNAHLVLTAKTTATRLICRDCWTPM